MDVQWQFPCAFAAVDGCHLPIKCPSGGAEAAKEYHNLKNFYSVVPMGLINAKQRFIWSSVGFPGNSHDSTILQSTNLYHKIIANGIIPPMAKNVQGTNIFPLILGDRAFPFKTWLTEPFSHAILKREEKCFSYCLSRAQMVSEYAFGLLKGRWRILHRKCESKKETEMCTTCLHCASQCVH